jgi:Zn-dependent peptidase ImmA (M78 family)
MVNLRKMIQMIIYKEPNYRKAQEKAYETIIHSKINTLPINLKNIINSFDNLHLQKYSVFARDNGLTIQETCDVFNSNEGCLWRRNDNQYIIFYNDTLTKKERVRFTIAHELGHFVLKHLEQGGKTNIARYSLSVEDSEIFEKEANYFAKRLLSPIPLVYSFKSYWNKMSYKHLISIFDISFSVSMYIIDELNRNYRYGISRVYHDVEKQFQDYIFSETHKNFCTQCNHVNIEVNKYCSICCNNNFTQINFDNFLYYKDFGDDNMIYSKIHVNEVSRAEVCPRCENENIKGHICQICGAFLTNRCTGLSDEILSDSYGLTHINIHQEKGCVDGSLLDGDARYCIHCGSISTFYFQGFLQDWYQEKKQFDNENNKPKLAAVPDILDEDLPF